MLWAARTDRRPVFHISARRSSNSVTAGPWHFTMNSLVLIRPLIRMDRPSADRAILVSLWNSSSPPLPPHPFHSSRSLFRENNSNAAYFAHYREFTRKEFRRNLVNGTRSICSKASIESGKLVSRVVSRLYNKHRSGLGRSR